MIRTSWPARPSSSVKIEDGREVFGSSSWTRFELGSLRQRPTRSALAFGRSGGRHARRRRSAPIESRICLLALAMETDCIDRQGSGCLACWFWRGGCTWDRGGRLRSHPNRTGHVCLAGRPATVGASALSLSSPVGTTGELDLCRFLTQHSGIGGGRTPSISQVALPLTAAPRLTSRQASSVDSFYNNAPATYHAKWRHPPSSWNWRVSQAPSPGCTRSGKARRPPKSGLFPHQAQLRRGRPTLAAA